MRPLNGNLLSISSGLEFEVVFYNGKKDINLDVTFELRNADEIPVFHHGATISSDNDSNEGVYRVKGSLPAHLLNGGNYQFKLIFGENQRYALFVLEDVVRFEVLNENLGNNSELLPGVIRPNIDYLVDFEKY